MNTKKSLFFIFSISLVFQVFSAWSQNVKPKSEKEKRAIETMFRSRPMSAEKLNAKMEKRQAAAKAEARGACAKLKTCCAKLTDEASKAACDGSLTTNDDSKCHSVLTSVEQCK